MRGPIALEVCVDTAAGLAAAVAGGADRVELCSALALGGLTPGPGLIAAAAACALPCHAMIRPRAGDFVLRPGDLEAMCADIEAVRAAGLAGVVIGVSRPDRTLDLDALRVLVTAAAGLDVTLHRCFDLTPDADAALEAAVGLGLRRILTSGQAATAPDGKAVLTRLAARAAGRIEVMAGGGVTAGHAADLIRTGVDALHASCAVPDPAPHDCAPLAIVADRITNRTDIAALRMAVDACTRHDTLREAAPA